MPSRRGLEQALLWLKNKMAEKDTLDAINAELTYNVIMDLQKRRKAIGALYHRDRMSKKKLMEELRELEIRNVTGQVYEDAMEKYSKELIEKELNED